MDFHDYMAHAQGKTEASEGKVIEWHGWKVPDLSASIHVGRLPRRQLIPLYVEVEHEGSNYIDILAYFRNDHYARAGLTFLDELARNRLAQNPPRFSR